MLDEYDSLYLERGLELAEMGRGLTRPNPMVGAVIVANGKIVGEGFHVAAGQDHAEIVAIKEAASRYGVNSLKGSTLYVTLEPCCVQGRTPPCVPALISIGFRRVVVGAIDPSPRVNGKGIQQLQQAGIQVDVAEGPLALRCQRQNNGFRKFVTIGLPFVIYKYAMSLDGRVATDEGDSKWISSAESRLIVHGVRAWVDAVMVGAGTLETDDPELTARDVNCRRQPLRVVIDCFLRLCQKSALVRTVSQGPVLVVCGPEVPVGRRTEVESWGVEIAVVPVSEGRADPLAVARLLAEREVENLLLEGGPTVAGSWWTAALIDQVMAFIAPRVLSGVRLRAPLQGPGSATVAEAVTLREVEIQPLGGDVCVSGYVTEAY